MIPSDDVATRSYPPAALPSRSWPYAGAVDVPVPPLFTDTVPVRPLEAIVTPEIEPPMIVGFVIVVFES